jgi:hypothetical protein
MDLLAIVFLIVALVAGGAAVALGVRAQRLGRRVAELEAQPRAASPELAPAAPPPAPVRAPAPPESAPPPRAEPVTPTPPAAPPPPAPAPAAADPLCAHAAGMARSAYSIARNLGFDFVPDPAHPTVHSVTLEIRSDWDVRAVEYLTPQRFECVQGATVKGKQVVVLVDSAKTPPAA